MHLSDGEIRAYQDGELAEDELQRLKSHLSGCLTCSQRAVDLQARTERVGRRLGGLRSPSVREPVPASAARLRLQAYNNQNGKEFVTMKNKIFSSKYRMAWVMVSIVAILGIAMLFPQVRAAADSFLGLFRIQKVTIVPVNPGNLPEQLGSSTQLQDMISNQVQFKENGQPEKVANADEASAKAGFAVRLPTQLQGLESLTVQPGGQAAFTVSLQQVQAVLDEIGRSDISLPKSLDGAQISVDVPAGVLAQYGGSCASDLENARQKGYDPDNPNLPRLPHCTSLMQMPSPTVSAPPGLDIAQIGEAFLQVMGMTREEAASFAQNVDWTTTLVVPIPRYAGDYQDVQVDGVTGTLILQNKESPRPMYMLIWVKDNNLYALTGPGGETEALQIGNSLQ